MSPAWGRGIRVAGSLTLLIAVVVILPEGTLSSAFERASPSVLLFAVGVFVGSHLIAAMKWRALLNVTEDVSVGAAVRAHFAGLLGAISPFGFVAGDVVRAGLVMSGSTGRAGVLLAGVVDRVADFAALMALALTGLLWVGVRSDMTAWAVIAVPTFAGAALVVSGVYLRRSSSPRLAAARDAFDAMAGRPALIIRAFLLAVVVQGTFVATNAYIGWSIGVSSSLGAWLLAWPAAKLTAYLPISVGGFGVRETALVALLAPFGGEPGPVMAAGLLWDAVLIAGSLGGWLTICVLPGLLSSGYQRPRTP